MQSEPVLIAGQWQPSKSSGTFTSINPTTLQPLANQFPISTWADCDAALASANDAAVALRAAGPEPIAKFLEDYAARIEAAKDQLVEIAFQETALAKAPRLSDVELPRTTGQLRQAASAVRNGSWAMPTIDTKTGIRSVFGPLGPVLVFGPNNFPFAFGSVSGGDFAAAIAGGNPVIGKANTSHPATTKLFAEIALQAVQAAGLHPATVQLLYRTSHEDGERLVADPRVGATGYTGSRSAGLKLKAAADAAGKPIYLELSSVNPVVILPGALEERGAEIAGEFTGSCLAGTGQMCTNPGLVILPGGPAADAFIADMAKRFTEAPVGTLLSPRVAESLKESVQVLQKAGAQVVAGGKPGGGAGASHSNTLLRVSGDHFVKHPHALQTEAFGNSSLFVVSDNLQQTIAVIDSLEGNLTGCIYSAKSGQDDAAYDQIAPHMRQKVGRILNDKMPTGVAVSAAMNHGGPYPATGHPGFTAVGIPPAIRRFAMLHCYDNVRSHRLPWLLQDKNPTGKTWRLVDGEWSTADVKSIG
jgi:alpha-ketoglutaric semialdehyde dehydrogenase